jgi:hypothetical protein
VADLFDIDPARIFTTGKHPRIVQARSLFWLKLLMSDNEI